MSIAKINLVFLAICSSWSSRHFGPLGNCVADPLSPIDLECETWIHVNHNHVKKGGGGKLKPNITLELNFVSLRNVCAPRPLDVPFARKHACFARELEASSSRSKISKLECSIPPQQMFDLRLGFRLSWPLLDSNNLCTAFGYYSIDINIAIYFNLAFTIYIIQINMFVLATYATICNFLKPTNQYSKYSKKRLVLMVQTVPQIVF